MRRAQTECEFGPFLGFAVADAVQRLRWIPAGAFAMGSPEGEAGRFEDEGPRHHVMIAHGFWLFDTACTQALWTAVLPQPGVAAPQRCRPTDRYARRACPWQ
jgi:formylglycine-generating enzyme required for sulfatase activity